MPKRTGISSILATGAGPESLALFREREKSCAAAKREGEEAVGAAVAGLFSHFPTSLPLKGARGYSELFCRDHAITRARISSSIEVPLRAAKCSKRRIMSSGISSITRSSFSSKHTFIATAFDQKNAQPISRIVHAHHA